MKKEKQKIILLLIALATTFLIVNTGTASITITENNNPKETGTQPVIHSDICLTEEDLPRLYDAKENIDNSEQKSIIQGVINEIEDDGSADSKDIKNILVGLNLFDTHIASGKIIGYFLDFIGKKDPQGDTKITGWPSSFLSRGLGDWWIGPAAYISWNSVLSESKTGSLKFTIGDTVIEENHEGLAVLFLGGWLHIDPPIVNFISFGFVFGWSPLIIWKEVTQEEPGDNTTGL